MSLAALQLTAIMPHLKLDRAFQLLAGLNAALTEWQIDLPIREAAFLAQLAHESAELRFFEEIASGAAYEGRKDLGNLSPGDGTRYKGRGPIQLTGRRNYRAAGVALGLDLEAHPETVAAPNVGFRVAGWFWKSHGLNATADAILTAPDQALVFDSITRTINGGLTGKKFRDAYFAKARAILGVT